MKNMLLIKIIQTIGVGFKEFFVLLENVKPIV